MEAPKDTYERNKHITDIEDVAFNRLFENYLKLNLKGPQKLIDVDSTDQESVLRDRAAGRPFPGMIYTFIHINKKNPVTLTARQTGKTMEFHDITPMLFCTSFNPQTGLIKGLNLNMMPPDARLKFLQVFWEQYKDIFNRIEELTEYNKNALNKKYISDAIAGKNPALFKMFSEKQNSPFGFAYRSYELRNCANFRMIEIEQWQYIPFFNAQQSFKKMQTSKIYDMYNREK
jgi:hypothetical protein